MNIALRLVGQIVIHDMSYVINIDATRRNIRCHQHLYMAGLEIMHGLFALVLRLVAVYGISPDSILFQHRRYFISSMFRPGEDQNAFHISISEKLQQQGILGVLIHKEDTLIYAVQSARSMRSLYM